MATKPWQVIVIVVGLLVGGGLILWNTFSGDRLDIEYSMTLIDAETGVVYSIPDYRDAGLILPAGRPGAQSEIALIQISKDEQTGAWRVSESGKRMIGALNVPIKAFDRDSGVLTAQPASFQKYPKQ